MIQERIIRRPEVEALTGLGPSYIYALIAERKFPRPIKIGKRAVGWPESIVQEWIQSRIQASTKEVSNGN